MENIRQTAVHADGEGGIIIQTRQDVTDIVEQNKKEYNSFDERAKWSDELFGNKIASIPFTVIDELNKQDLEEILGKRPFETRTTYDEFVNGTDKAHVKKTRKKKSVENEGMIDHNADLPENRSSQD